MVEDNKMIALQHTLDQWREEDKLKYKVEKCFNLFILCFSLGITFGGLALAYSRWFGIIALIFGVLGILLINRYLTHKHLFKSLYGNYWMDI
jgi:hypothetical protein